jgi:hypothetical protein
MTIPEFKTKLKTAPTTISFKETMQVIEDHYNFNPTAFTNGDTINNTKQNNGSCKLFAFAMQEEFTKEETLFSFGEYYQSVLEDKNGTSHQNIRNFMKTGFKGLSFKNEALTLKK